MPSLASIDLNAIYALTLLLEERSVSRAAAAFGITQSAMSHRLRQLRAHFDDPLLVASGRRLVLTEFAASLCPALHDSFAQLAEVILPRPSFDAATSERTFVISTSDYGEFVVLPRALARIRSAAPRVHIRFVPPRADDLARLESGVIDVTVGPPLGPAAGFVQRQLPPEPFVVVVRSGHPKIRRKPLMSTYLAADHLAVSPRGTPGTIVDTILEEQGKTRNVAVTVGHFTTAPFIIAESDLVWTAPKPMSMAASRYVDLAAFAPPFEIAPFLPCLAWHERQRLDPGHSWFRSLIIDIQSAG